MIRKFVVNGTEYDSPDTMPPDVRREYERALRLVADMGKGAGPSGTTDKTVETSCRPRFAPASSRPCSKTGACAIRGW